MANLPSIKSGKVQINSVYHDVTQATFKLTQEDIGYATIVDPDDPAWKKQLAGGLLQGEGSITGLWNTSNETATYPAPFSVANVPFVYRMGAYNFTASIFMSDIQIDKGESGPATFTANWKSDGAITWAAVA